MRATAQHWETGDSLENHAALIRRQVEASLQDPQTRLLAAAITSGSFDDYRDPRTGQSVPVVPYHGRYYRGARDWRAAGRLCGMRDELCEITQLWNFCVLNIRYAQDQAGEDTYCTLRSTLEAGSGDCFPQGTLLLTDDYRLTPIEHLRPGQRIWGRDRWSEVGVVAPKGEREITSIRLNNGSWLQLTDEHKVYVAHCPRHKLDRKGVACSCPVSEREIVRVAVAELTPRMVLLAPDRIPFGAYDQDPEMAWLDGYFIADGWAEDYRFSLSGRDGKPKEATKLRAQRMLGQRGIATRWDARYLAVNDADLAQHMATFGRSAQNKRLPHVGYTQRAAASLLEGLLLDAGLHTNATGRTWSSTSYELAVQMRVLCRMFGQRVGWASIADHGGLGKNPIHRLHLSDGTSGKAPRLLRVREILRPGVSRYVWDISTDDHYVYLPEHDVTVSNCDDCTVALAALCGAMGYHSVARIISVHGQTWDHVYPVIKTRSGWVPLDMTEKGKKPGWEYKRAARRKDFALV